MKFDRNTVLGFVVLALLFFGYFYYTNKEQSLFRKEQARLDSIANAQKPKQDTLAVKKDSARADSTDKIVKAGNFKDAVNGTEQIVTVKTNVFTIAFTNKGGQPKWIELNHFKSMDSGRVRLAASDFDKIGYTVNTGPGQIQQTSNLYFQPGVMTKNADGTTAVSFVLASSDSASAASVIHEFVVKPDDYMIDFGVKLKGADKLLSQGIMNLSWQYAAAQQEPSVSYEKQNTQIGYIEDGEFDYHTVGNRSDKEWDESVKWVGIRQRFFTSFLVAKDKFSSGNMEWSVPPDEKKTIVQATTQMRVPVAVASEASVAFSLYYGPSDYHLLRKYDQQFDKLVNLGQGMYAFVRPLNKFIIVPIFDFLKGLTGNMGIAILLLTVFIRLITSPLMYPGYRTSAQMKILRPDLAKLKEKFPDQQQYAMEQMKFMREAGVNQFAGCIPSLLQIPIFFALFSFFNAETSLRGAEFLWSADLSAFDDPIKFGFSIPLLGSHLSLFNITAVITSFLISLYSMSMTPDQSNPVLKYMPYIFPVFLLFFFNSLPSALTWYYTVSNLITLGLQFVIQNYIINHDKLVARIEANRKKPKTKSKWQERLEQMQEQQKKMKETQQKGKR
ncbi:MAG: membrane protein insertase YidC [Chitinophagaceae bacterium]|nr:membrane protein insertase YidC [Chitinophagaceae bacterium]